MTSAELRLHMTCKRPIAAALVCGVSFFAAFTSSSIRVATPGSLCRYSTNIIIVEKKVGGGGEREKGKKGKGDWEGVEGEREEGEVKERRDKISIV